MTVLGRDVMFHSALSFMSNSVSVRSICTASDICRSIVSLRYEPVTFIPNCWVSPPCSSTQCRHNGEPFISRAPNLLRCSPPKALLAVSPLYTFLVQLSPKHFIAYVTLSVWQFPLPVVVQTKQSSLPQLPVLNGFDRWSSLFRVRPVRSTTRIRSPLLRIACSYIFFSFPSGVDGAKRTESNPPSLYQSFFFRSFSSILSSLRQSLGRCMGLIPLSSLFFIVWCALIADFYILYKGNI